MKQDWTSADIPDLSRKIIVITGSNSGIGFQTALEFARKNAFVWLACRNEEKANVALARIREQVPNAKVKYAHLDLADLSTIKPLVDLVKKDSGRIDILINNAGFFPNEKRLETKDGFENTMGANHLGHFALTAAMLSLLKKSDFPRVVNVASDAHKSGKLNFDDFDMIKSYSALTAYSNSKLANLLFSFELQKRADEAGWKLIVTSAHPGFAMTGLTGGDRTTMVKKFFGFLAQVFAQSDVQGAWPTEYAAISDDVVPNGYYGPNGRFEMSGNPKQVNPAKSALNEDSAMKIWELSEEKTKTKFQFK